MDALTSEIRPPVIQIRDLSVGYAGHQQSVVMQGLNLDIARGEFLALVGPSGVGKSTLLRVIAGLMPPASGQVIVEPPHEPDCRQIGFVFQDARLLPWRKVLANVEYGLEDLLKSRAERRARAQAALALVGLADYADRWPHQLSGGQKQRVAIARALAVRPALLLMDEPFSALDPTTRHSLQDELLRLWKESGTSIILATHDMSEAMYLADRIIVLDGKPAHITQAYHIYHPRPRVRPSNDWTKEAQDFSSAPLSSRLLQQPVAAMSEAGRMPNDNVHQDTNKPAKWKLIVDLFHQYPFRTH